MAGLTLSPAGILNVWERNGGSSAHGAVAVAVSLAESGGNERAVSPSSDYGLWQINSIHFRTFGVNSSTVLDPDTNARIAISLSGNGTNWAPWCTCWTNPARDCGHGYLPTPQPGSPAYNQLDRAAAGIGGAGAALAAAPLRIDLGTVTSAWSGFQDFVGSYARWNYSAIAVSRTRIRGA